MLETVLIANRGEIAVRVMRAANELDVRSIAMYTAADRGSIHRVKADESYEVGDPSRPLAGYLDVDEIVGLARRVGADAVHPGYGFLSESPALARACEAAGVQFVGPPPDVLEAAGDKVAARRHAVSARIPVLPASDLLEDDDVAAAEAERIGYPVFVKAAGGGGGRGLRLVTDPGELRDAVASARHEAAGGFGEEAVFLERAVLRPRHIEVQVLADSDGEVVHLYERDCSVQRRHQKVLEIAPAPGLDPAVRERICADAVRFAEQVGYRNAGTVEFLLDEDGQHFLIEMNPRIQVEHTITEEVCNVDLVQAQLRIAAGATHADLGLSQETITPRGVAVQCRVTTEDPANRFRPGTGRVTAFRSTGGPGIRIDAGSAYVGAEISPYFDSLLAKLTARGSDLPGAARRARRGLAEFRVRGVPTNLAFLRALLSDPDHLAENLSTAYLDEHPHLLEAVDSRDRASRLLDYLGDVTVHRPYGDPPGLDDPVRWLPRGADSGAGAGAGTTAGGRADVGPEGAPRLVGAPTPGSRDRLDADGPEAFAAWLRDTEAVGVTDTTMRDAHQSLLATRMRTYDMLAVAPHLAATCPQLLSLEVWGGATFDVALRFLREDPWERLARLRAAVPNICLQMLIRGQNAVGYHRYPPAVVDAFVREAADVGVDIFRVFDALNDVERMRPAIEAVRVHGRLAEGTMCYTGDLTDPRETVYTLDYYLGVAERLVAAGAHVLCIKDMAGLLRAPAAATLVTALRERFDAPVHLHTHDTAGGQLATYHAAIEAGVDAVDGAAAPLAGTTSQPPLPAIVAATDGTPRATGIDLDALSALEPYWEGVRELYAPFEQGLPAPTGRVHQHQIPGGQLSNLVGQASALGLEGGFTEIAERYIQADRLLGGLIKVTPTSKVVGDLALFMALNDVAPDELEADPGRYDIPASVLEFLAGDLGVPPAGWPEPFRTRAIAAHEVEVPDRQLSDEDRAGLDEGGEVARELLSRLLFAGPAEEFASARRSYGDLAVLPTEAFFHGLHPGREVQVELEPGVRLTVELDAVGDVDDSGIRTLYLKLNGGPRVIEVIDRNVYTEQPVRESADPDDPGHVATQMTGVVTIEVSEGDTVDEGQVVGIVEAMKMESPIRAHAGGRVERVVAPSGTRVEPGDLLLVLEVG